jgi:hypothetical protein
MKPINITIFNEALGSRPVVGRRRQLFGMGYKMLNIEITAQYCTNHVVGMLAFRIGP